MRQSACLVHISTMYMHGGHLGNVTWTIYIKNKIQTLDPLEAKQTVQWEVVWAILRNY